MPRTSVELYCGPELDGDEIPDNSGDGDSDLAQITLNQLPSDMTDGYVQIVLSDPTAVRLFEPDGSLLMERIGITDPDRHPFHLRND